MDVTKFKNFKLNSPRLFSFKKRMIMRLFPIRKVLFLSLASLFLSAEAFAIVGGCALNESFNHCLPQALRLEMAQSTIAVLDTTSSHAFSRCTGTLLENNLILTAAHCVQSLPKNLWIVFSTYESSILDRRAVIKIETLKSYKSFGLPTLQKQNNDLALIQFEGAVPSKYKPRRLKDLVQPTYNWPADANKVVRGFVAGYGISDQNKSDAGELRFAGVSFDQPQMFKTHFIKSKPQLSEGICKGDSGGPLFIIDEKKQLRLVGVTSAIQGSCHGNSYYNLIESYNADLIELHQKILF